MGKRENIKTTHKQIVEYWFEKLKDSEFNIDWSNADKECWCCGHNTRLQRAHIIPDSLGGTDEPGNLILLCGRCHSVAPNVIDPEIMWDWLKAYNSNNVIPLSMLLGLKEYKFIYKKSVVEDLKYGFDKATENYGDLDYEEIKKQLYSVGRGTSFHFGQPYFNPSTYAGLLRMFLKDFALKYGVNFPVEENVENEISILSFF